MTLIASLCFFARLFSLPFICFTSYDSDSFFLLLGIIGVGVGISASFLCIIS